MATQYQQINSDASFVKMSADGQNGSGKTCTIAQLACGLAKEYGNGGAVHVFDSSDRWSAWKTHIFDVEQVPVEITVGTSIAALQYVAEKAVRDQCSVLVGDDLTVPWMEGVSSFAYENGNLTFDRRQQLINEWNKFVAPFQTGPFHALACGRLGYQWENVENVETGERELLQGNSKFNAGGSANFGYECVLEVELRRRKRRIAGFLRGKILMEYVCDVVKDANSILNSQQFIFTDFPKGQYQKGDYRKVLDAFRAHVDFRRRLQPSPRFDGTSRKLIVSGKTQWARSNADRAALLEDLEANLKTCFPGGEKRSKLDEMFRNLTLEGLNGHMSWSRMADPEETTIDQIERNLFIVRALRKRMQGGEKPTDHNSLVGLLHLATEDVLHPANGKTLLEVMTMGSLPKPGPQKVVAVMDAAPEEQYGD